MPAAAKIRSLSGRNAPFNLAWHTLLRLSIPGFVPAGLSVYRKPAKVDVHLSASVEPAMSDSSIFLPCSTVGGAEFRQAGQWQWFQGYISKEEA